MLDNLSLLLGRLATVQRPSWPVDDDLSAMIMMLGFLARASCRHASEPECRSLCLTVRGRARHDLRHHDNLNMDAQTRLSASRQRDLASQGRLLLVCRTRQESVT